MSVFPTLKTGAVTQYPLTRSLQFVTQTVEFIDGSRQSYRLRGRAARRWNIRLEKLDPEELNAVIDFAEEVGSGVFSFVDPVDGSTVGRCAIADAGVSATMTSEANGGAVLTIEEIA